MTSREFDKPETLGKWQKVRRSCGNVAIALGIVGYCLLIVLATMPPHALNDVLVEFVAILSLLAGLLASIGRRWWGLALALVLFLIVPMFATLGT